MEPFANRKLLGAIRAAQEDAQEDDYRLGMIQEYIKDRDRVCNIELWEEALKNPYTKPEKRDLQDIRLMMEGLGDWERDQKLIKTPRYGPQRHWKRREIFAGSVQESFKLVTESEELPF